MVKKLTLSLTSRPSRPSANLRSYHRVAGEDGVASFDVKTLSDLGNWAKRFGGESSLNMDLYQDLKIYIKTIIAHIYIYMGSG